MIRVIFLELLNRSIAAGWLVAVILLLRIVLQRFPRRVFCLTWGIVGIRLILPFLFESTFSLIPSTQTIAPSFDLGRMVVHSGIEQVDTSVNLYLDNRFDAAAVIPKVWYDSAMEICSVIWVIGTALLLLYGVTAEIRLRRKVRASLCCGGNVYICDDIASAFVLGVIKPRIYLPSVMGHTQTRSVLLHERAHIARHDSLWKMLGFFLLCVYWFNPLIWLAYFCFGHDIELACDECVLSQMAVEEKREYAQSLLDCSIRRKMVALSPVAFGEVGVKRRIKSIVWFKNIGERTTAFALVLCVILAVGFLTNPTVHASEFESFANTAGNVITLSRCDCKGMHLVSGEYFHSHDAAIKRDCEFYSTFDFGCFHIHERGTVMRVYNCSSCDEVLYAEPLYEGYRCLSSKGELVKTE